MLKFRAYEFSKIRSKCAHCKQFLSDFRISRRQRAFILNQRAVNLEREHARGECGKARVRVQRYCRMLIVASVVEKLIERIRTGNDSAI